MSSILCVGKAFVVKFSTKLSVLCVCKSRWSISLSPFDLQVISTWYRMRVTRSALTGQATLCWFRRAKISLPVFLEHPLMISVRLYGPSDVCIFEDFGAGLVVNVEDGSCDTVVVWPGCCSDVVDCSCVEVAAVSSE